MEEDITLSEKRILDSLPKIITINDKFTNSIDTIEYQDHHNLFSNRILVKLELVVDNVKCINKLNNNAYIDIENKQMSLRFIKRLLNNIINLIDQNIEISEKTYHVGALKYIVEDAILTIHRRFNNFKIGTPFILAEHDIISSIKIFQETNLTKIIDFKEFDVNEIQLPIKLVGTLEDIPVYEIDNYLYTDDKGQGKLFKDQVVVGFTGSKKSVGPRLCFKYLYNVIENDLLFMDGPNNYINIQSRSEYKIISAGNIKDLYVTFKIKED